MPELGQPRTGRQLSVMRPQLLIYYQFNSILVPNVPGHPRPGVREPGLVSGYVQVTAFASAHYVVTRLIHAQRISQRIKNN